MLCKCCASFIERVYYIFVIKVLPFVLIPLLILSALGYWRFVYLPKQALTSPKVPNVQPVEVPKSLPGATLDERLNSLEKSVETLIKEINALKSSSSQTQGTDGTRLTNAESAIVELKARVSALEKATPTPLSSTTQSAVYIPLGSGGGPWANQDWYSTPEYEVSLDPANYPNYKGMYLEVSFRLVEQVGTASVRLYNATDGSATSSQVENTSTSFSLKTSSSFKLPTGTKTYRLQVKSSEGKNLFIQTARIRVSF